MTGASPTAHTEELVKDVLEAMRRVSSGDDSVVEELAEDEAAPEIKKDPDALLCDTKTVARANGTKYHVRKLGKHDDIAFIRHCRTIKQSPLLTGPPGTGKTALLDAAFAQDGFYTIQGTGDTEVADFIGGYVQTGPSEFTWVDGPMIRAMEEGKPLYIDEIALIDPKVMALPYGVMDGRDELAITQNPSRGTVKVREGFFVVAACNPNAPGARMSEALLSRFLIQFEVKTDYKLAKKLGVNAKVVTAAQNLQSKVAAGECGWAPQLRELLAQRDTENAFGLDLSLENLVGCAPEIDRAVVADVVGKAFGKTVKSLELV